MLNCFFILFLNSKLLTITRSANFKKKEKIFLLIIFCEYPTGAAFDLIITLHFNIFAKIIAYRLLLKEKINILFFFLKKKLISKIIDIKVLKILLIRFQ